MADVTDPETTQPETAPPPPSKRPDGEARRQADDPETPLPGGEPDHSMHDETKLGWDQAPTDQDGDDARHPKQRGLGGSNPD